MQQECYLNLHPLNTYNLVEKVKCLIQNVVTENDKETEDMNQKWPTSSLKHTQPKLLLLFQQMSWFQGRAAVALHNTRCSYPLELVWRLAAMEGREDMVPSVLYVACLESCSTGAGSEPSTGEMSSSHLQHSSKATGRHTIWSYMQK